MWFALSGCVTALRLLNRTSWPLALQACSTSYASIHRGEIASMCHWPSRPHRETSLFPDARKALIDPKFLWALVAAIFLSGSTYALLDFRVRSHDQAIAALEREVARIPEVERDVHDVQGRLREHGEAINWIGSAVQKIADANDVKLPERPVVRE